MKALKSGASVKLGRRKSAIIMGGEQHKGATSFLPKQIEQADRQKLYRDQGIIWIAPTRGSVWAEVVVSWLSLQWPMNHFRTPLFIAKTMEVGEAYQGLIGATIDRKGLRETFESEYADMLWKAPFILTTEEDNVLPNDTVPQLMKAIYTCPDCGGEVGGEEWRCDAGHHGFDAVSGLYFLKSTPPVPMAYGQPKKGRGKIDHVNFWPQSIKEPIKKGSVIEVYGIAQGCALWRKDLFKRVKKPWFVTPGPGWTQDLAFCKKAKTEAGARFGVHCGVKVGHLNPNTGILY